MKKLTAIIGICLIACITQAQTAGTPVSTPTAPAADQSKSVKAKKHLTPEERLANIDKRIAKRQAQEQKATAKGKTDIAAAIQKIIVDLNNMKTAINNKDKAAFKTANEQRKQDRGGVESVKEGRQGEEHENFRLDNNPGSNHKTIRILKY